MNQHATSYLELVYRCNNFPIEGESKREYYELYIPNDDAPHGYLLPHIVQKMPWTAKFHLQHDYPRRVSVLDSSGGTDTTNAVNTAFSELVTMCIEQNTFHVLDGKHSEPFAILGANYPAQIERFASSLFGITACGACLVAYVHSGDGMRLWIPRRAAHLYSSPGLLDTTVAGGVKAGVSPLETIIEEAAEEASLPENLIREKVRPCGSITCMSFTGDDWPGEKGLVMPDVLYVYDIELAADVIVKPHDEEVDNFRCMSVGEVQHALISRQFKPDAAIVLIDFLIRHSIITAENETNYVEIIMHLHRRLPFRIKPAR